MPEFAGIDHASLSVTDLDRSERFYTDLLGLFHARKLRAHQVALEHLAWDRVHQTLHLTRPFYERFNPAISARDFTLRAGALDRSLDLLAVLRP